MLCTLGVMLAMGSQSFIPADDPSLVYTGRISFADRKAPAFYYGYSGFKTRFEGTSIALEFEEDNWGHASWVGVRIDDGVEVPLLLHKNQRTIYQVAVGLKKGVHDLFVYRRTDSVSGAYKLHGLYLDLGCKLTDPGPRPTRRIEFYGDSVTGGAWVEAIGYEAKSDSEVKTDHDNEKLGNTYWSFAAIAARKLNAEAHVIGLGGLALNDGNGWWCGEDTIGLLTTWDKLDPIKQRMTQWDFSRFVPQVVVVAIGQNDGRRMDINNLETNRKWKADYNLLLDKMRAKYPQSTFILATTLLYHDKGWDDAVEAVAKARKDKVLYYRYKRAGKGTPGHLRLAEHQEMADELVRFINKQKGIWEVQ